MSWKGLFGDIWKDYKKRTVFGEVTVHIIAMLAKNIANELL